MKAKESGEQATIRKYTACHAVTRYHVPNHGMAKVYWAPDYNKIYKEGIEVRNLVPVITLRKYTTTYNLMKLLACSRLTLCAVEPVRRRTAVAGSKPST